MNCLPLILFFLPLWVRQLLPVIVPAAVCGFLLRRRFGWRKPFCIVLAVLMLCLTVNLFRPVLICGEKYETYLTEELREGIYEFFPGWKHLPLIPLYYEITDARKGYIEVTKHWLYGGQNRVTVALDEQGNVVPEMLD